jgi:hypothetical protein
MSVQSFHRLPEMRFFLAQILYNGGPRLYFSRRPPARDPPG